MFGTMSYPSWMIGFMVLSANAFLQIQGFCDGDFDFLCSNNECIRDAYRCDRETDCTSDEIGCPASSCGGILTAASGVITSPNYPFSYPSNAKCTWIIRGPEGSHIQLRVTRFALESSEYRPEYGGDVCYDWLQILEDKDSDTGILCGTLDYDFLYSIRNYVWMQFRSDDTSSGLGFRIEYEIVPCNNNTSFQCNNGDCISFIAECDDSNDCSDNSDELECLTRECTSDEFTCVVPDNRRCIGNSELCDGFEDCANGADEWDCNEECSFAEFECDLPDTRRCIEHDEQCDGVEDCADGADELNCHPDCDDDFDYLCDNGRCIYLGFICDTDNDCRDNSDEGLCPVATCGGQLTATSGEITSPNYPSRYPNDAKCAWTIQGPLRSTITLRFRDFDLQSPSRGGTTYNPIDICADWLEIFESKSDKHDEASIFCGYISYKTYTSKGNYLWIQFWSDSDVVDSGFRIEYSIRSSSSGNNLGSSGGSSGSSGPGDKTILIAAGGSLAGLIVITFLIVKVCRKRTANNSSSARGNANSRNNAAYERDVVVISTNKAPPK